MELNQATALINHKNIFTTAKTAWADLGCGSGLFTTALSHKLAPGSKIYAVDKSEAALKNILRSVNVITEKIIADFVKSDLNLPPLDGIIMANSLHFVRDKIPLIRKLSKYLKSEGHFLIVEYDMDMPNQWVPFPLSYQSLHQLFPTLGYGFIEKIHELPSLYNRANIYSVLIAKNA